jgi:hypothetical protein
MKHLLLILTAALLVTSATQAEETGYERKAFKSRYGLWENVRCMADAVQITTGTDRFRTSGFSVSKMEADARSQLAQLGFPNFCEPSTTPALLTMISVKLEIRTEVEDNGSFVYFVRLQAAVPDGDFARTNFGQSTTWESSGKLGYTPKDPGHSKLRAAVSEQIEEFATFMLRTRNMHNG